MEGPSYLLVGSYHGLEGLLSPTLFVIVHTLVLLRQSMHKAKCVTCVHKTEYY